MFLLIKKQKTFINRERKVRFFELFEGPLTWVGETDSVGYVTAMHRFSSHLTRTIAISMFSLYLVSVSAESHASDGNPPSGPIAVVSGGLSVSTDSTLVVYDAGLRVGLTAGYEFDLDLPWRTTLTAQFTLGSSTWRFASPLNEGTHSIFLAMLGVTYTQYAPFQVPDVSVWTSLGFGLGSSSIEYDGFLGTNAMTEAHSGIAFSFQAGTAYHFLPYVALGLFMEVTDAGLEELTDLSFGSSSFDFGLVVRGQLPH